MAIAAIESDCFNVGLSSSRKEGALPTLSIAANGGTRQARWARGLEVLRWARGRETSIAGNARRPGPGARRREAWFLGTPAPDDKTLFHLVPRNQDARKALSHPDDRRFPGCPGRESSGIAHVFSLWIELGASLPQLEILGGGYATTT
jgi:hypothetical protein